MLAVLVWFLFLTTSNPYSHTVQAGPFYSSQDCYSVLNQSTAPPGSWFSCESHYEPGTSILWL